MRALAAILAPLVLGLCLTACAGGGPEGGVATYDALKSAQQACAAKGGSLVLKKEGDAEDIGAYACKRN